MKTDERELWKFPSVRGFMERNKISWGMVLFFMLLAYGIKVFNVSISHDTETIMATADVQYENWYTMGRFGLMFLKKILGTYIFNPYVASFLMFITMLVNSVVWTYFFAWIGGERKNAYKNTWIFPTVFFTSMIMAEQCGFLLQAYEVNVALMLVGLALLNLYKVFLEGRRLYWCLPAVICCVLAFSSYQSLVPLFTSGAAMGFLLMYDKIVQEDADRMTCKFCCQLILKLIAVFLFSFVVYTIINKIVLGCMGLETTSYITEQVMWGKLPAKTCIKNILDHICKVFSGEGIFYVKMTTVIFVVMLLYMLIGIRKKTACYFIYMLAGIYCLCSPFLLTVFLGIGQTARADILLPFVSGFLFQYLFDRLAEQEKKVWKMGYAALSLVLCVLALYQSLSSARLYYTQYAQYEEDVRLAVKITDRIDKLGLGEIPDEPVVFIGSRDPQKNPSCYDDDDLELIGKSFFGVSYYAGHGTYVMLHFLDTLGYSYNIPSVEQIVAAQELQETMPTWPYEGSVAEKDGIIIVKLG